MAILLNEMRKPRYLILALLLMSLIFSCKKADVKGVSNLNGNKIGVHGHGGMGIASTYPLNSYESLTAALALGADGVEIDVQMTSDSVLVAFHNNTLDANTKCSGLISDFTWAELKECEHRNTVFGQHQIVAIEEVVGSWAEFEGKTVVLDLKILTNSNTEQFKKAFAQKVIELVEAHNLGQVIMIEAPDILFLQSIQSVKPNYKLIFVTGVFSQAMTMAKNSGLYGIAMDTAHLSKEQIKEAHDNGLRVAVWNTQSRRDNVEAINKSPDFIQTDKLKSLLRLLK